jgi:glycosyltransferase involved in cell wall biosynthesis
MTVKIRVAMVAACPFPYPRGTPVRIYRMAEILSELGLEVHVITYHLGQRETAPPFITHRIPNLNFYKKLSPGPSFLKLMVVDPFLTIKILSLHRKYQFDIIHAHHVEGFLASLPARFYGNTPIIFDMHTLLSTELQYYQLGLDTNWLEKIGRFFDWHLPKYADHVISVTEEIKAQLITNVHIQPGRISVIPNGIEIEHFAHAGEKQRAESDPVILGYAGNFAQYQGVEIMLEAVCILRQSCPNVRLYLYSNETIDKYKPIIEQLNIGSLVNILPSKFQDLPQQLAAADILLNPRPAGAGHPLKLLNYMAAGKPIVSLAGSAHFLMHGENAWIVTDNKPQAFAGGIKHILSNKKLGAEIGKNAKVFARKNFSWQSRGKNILEIYTQLL